MVQKGDEVRTTRLLLLQLLGLGTTINESGKPKLLIEIPFANE